MKFDKLNEDALPPWAWLFVPVVYPILRALGLLVKRCLTIKEYAIYTMEFQKTEIRAAYKIHPKRTLLFALGVILVVLALVLAFLIHLLSLQF